MTADEKQIENLSNANRKLREENNSLLNQVENFTTALKLKETEAGNLVEQLKAKDRLLHLAKELMDSLAGQLAGNTEEKIS